MTTPGQPFPVANITAATPTTLAGLLKGTGSLIAAATAGVDYVTPTEAAAAYDALGAATTAQSNAEAFASSAAGTAQSNAESYAASQASTAQSNAESYAASQASAAQAAAESFATGAASTVQGNLTTHTGLTTTAHGGIVASTDSRLTDARTPTAHASSHAAAGSDPLSLSAAQVSGLATVATSGSYDDLSNKPTIPAAQVQSDWNEATTSAADYIKNKPMLGTAAAHAATDFQAAASDYLKSPAVVYTSTIAGIHGDGVTDDGNLIKAVAIALSAAGGGTIIADMPHAIRSGMMTAPSNVTWECLPSGQYIYFGAAATPVAVTTLTGSIGTGAAPFNITVASVALLPNYAVSFILTIDSETFTIQGPPSGTTLSVTARSGSSAHTSSTQVFMGGVDDTCWMNQHPRRAMPVTGNVWPIQRGQGSSSAATHSAGETVTIYGPALFGANNSYNGPKTTITNSGGISSSATSMNVASVSNFPSASQLPFDVQIGSEIVSVTGMGGSGNKTWTITRAQNSTTAASHSNGATLYWTLASTGTTAICLGNAPSTPPKTPFTILVDSEQMTVNSIVNGLFAVASVTRGANSTTPAMHSNGANVFFIGAPYGVTTLAAAITSTGQATMQVNSWLPFVNAAAPYNNPFTVYVASEQMYAQLGSTTLDNSSNTVALPIQVSVDNGSTIVLGALQAEFLTTVPSGGLLLDISQSGTGPTETVLCTAVAGDNATLTVTRAQLGTTQQTWSAGAVVTEHILDDNIVFRRFNLNCQGQTYANVNNCSTANRWSVAMLLTGINHLAFDQCTIIDSPTFCINIGNVEVFTALDNLLTYENWSPGQNDDRIHIWGPCETVLVRGGLLQSNDNSFALNFNELGAQNDLQPQFGSGGNIGTVIVDDVQIAAGGKPPIAFYGDVNTYATTVLLSNLDLTQSGLPNLEDYSSYTQIGSLVLNNVIANPFATYYSAVITLGLHSTITTLCMMGVSFATASSLVSGGTITNKEVAACYPTS